MLRDDLREDAFEQGQIVWAKMYIRWDPTTHAPMLSGATAYGKSFGEG
ncbi:MAG TPA: hypothetical protein VHG11_09310 [Pseudorhizobium sp.]|nr:hypothetical protein [Pseudorhizobium sp.]